MIYNLSKSCSRCKRVKYISKHVIKQTRKLTLLNIIWPILEGMFQILGACWYLFAVQRFDDCCTGVCYETIHCLYEYMYCGSHRLKGYEAWQNISQNVINVQCAITEDNPAPFNYGIYTLALSSNIIYMKNFFTKYCYCLWWGLQNLRWASSSCLVCFFQRLEREKT